MELLSCRASLRVHIPVCFALFLCLSSEQGGPAARSPDQAGCKDGTLNVTLRRALTGKFTQDDSLELLVNSLQLPPPALYVPLFI